jgi:hypothetical protein
VPPIMHQQHRLDGGAPLLTVSPNDDDTNAQHIPPVGDRRRSTTEVDSEADFVKNLVKRQLNLELKYKKDAAMFDFRPDPSKRKSMLAPIANLSKG